MKMHVRDEIPRKSAQEAEIDRLLAEEFECDPGFSGRFIELCGFKCPSFVVTSVVPEPSLGGEGFGDLLVCGQSEGLQVAFLIEDKITAGPAVRQAQRYARYAEFLRSERYDQVWTILLAPASYQGERKFYDTSVDLESIISILKAADPVRLNYRRSIIDRALKKKSSSGVRVPDLEMHKLHVDYANFAKKWCEVNNFLLKFPDLKESYYDGDSWINKIRAPDFPLDVYLRHRLWVSVKSNLGRVDLIIQNLSEFDEVALRGCLPVEAIIEDYSKGRGIQISLYVPQMKQQSGFDPAVCEGALVRMRELTEFYLNTYVHKFYNRLHG